MPKLPKKSLLRNVKKPTKDSFKPPLWKGPEEDGITQSMLNRFLSCRERFRLSVIEGWEAPRDFNASIEYGHMWHVCEEVWAKDHKDDRAWKKALADHTVSLTRLHPLSQEQIVKWYNVCLVQFPIYQQYWSKHPHLRNRTPLLEEACFRVPYKLPSGSVVVLRGKWDSVDLVKSRRKEVWLQDNKTKYAINDEKIQQQLGFDLQAMFYLVALRYALREEQYPQLSGLKLDWLKGIRYNVIRRPLAGGKGSIRPHKPTKKNPQGESDKAFYERLGEVIKSDPSEFFARWEVEVALSDLKRFERRVLQPLLQQVVDWYEFMEYCEFDPWSISPDRFGCDECLYPLYSIHWQHPYGTYNILNEGGSTEFDEYLKTGSTLRLQRKTKLFSELDD